MLWKKIDAVENPPSWLDTQDLGYFARDYIPNARFNKCEGTSLIINLKKPVERRGMRDWTYKERAIKQFARELLQILPEGGIISSIPSSKMEDDPEYDHRLDITLKLVAQSCPSIQIEKPISLNNPIPSAHSGGPRAPCELLPYYRWEGFSKSISEIILIDDVITSGGHFKACQQIIKINCPDVNVIGVFWARSIRDS